MNHANDECFFPHRAWTFLNKNSERNLFHCLKCSGDIYCFSPIQREKIHTKFLMIFTCAFSLFLALIKKFKRLRGFIETKETSLTVAVDKGNLVCKLLLCDGAIVDSADTRERTPLYAAASRWYSDVWRLIVIFIYCCLILN